MASISGVNTNSVFIAEILSKKGTDIKNILLCWYRSFKRMSFYTDMSSSITEAVAVIVVNTIKTLNISVIIYTTSIHS